MNRYFFQSNEFCGTVAASLAIVILLFGNMRSKSLNKWRLIFYQRILSAAAQDVFGHRFEGVGKPKNTDDFSAFAH